MSEENEHPPTEIEPIGSKSVDADVTIKSAPIPQKKQRRARARRARARVVENMPDDPKEWTTPSKYDIAPPPPLDAPVTLEDILRAKAVLARAEAALGVAQVKPKEVPVPLHPPGIEDPAQGDKTPAVVEWYRDHAPEEYQRRYSGRKTHLADRTRERRFEPLPMGVTPATFPADPDGFNLSQRDDSGRAPRNTADL